MVTDALTPIFRKEYRKKSLILERNLDPGPQLVDYIVLATFLTFCQNIKFSVEPECPESIVLYNQELKYLFGIN